MYSGEADLEGTGVSITDVFDKMQHPYTQALFPLDPAAPAPTRTPPAPLVAIPGNFPLPQRSVRKGALQFRPRAATNFVAGSHVGTPPGGAATPGEIPSAGGWRQGRPP